MHGVFVLLEVSRRGVGSPPKPSDQISYPDI